MSAFLKVHVTLNLTLYSQEIYKLPHGKIECMSVPEEEMLMNEAQWYCSAEDKAQYIKFVQEELMLALQDVRSITKTFDPIDHANQNPKN